MSEEVKAPKFTPGPWVLFPPELALDDKGNEMTGCFSYPGGVDGKDGSGICTFGHPDDDNGSGWAFDNAADHYLIAAAPEMHEALLRAREEIRFLQATANTAVGDSTVEFIDDVLRKANGGE